MLTFRLQDLQLNVEIVQAGTSLVLWWELQLPCTLYCVSVAGPTDWVSCSWQAQTGIDHNTTQRWMLDDVHGDI